jgi:hypothetical protein
MLWKIAEHTDDENKRWCYMRAAEWVQWPLFVSQPIIPLLLFFTAPVTIFAGIILVGWLWSLIRYRIVNPDLAFLGCTFVVFLKWPSALICAGLLLWRNDYGLAVLSALWPAVALGLFALVPPGLIGVIEKKFFAKLLDIPESVLFEKSPVDWASSVATYLTPLLFMAVVCGAWYLWTRLR